MREYSRVSPRFWIGATGKRIRQSGVEAQLVALYLVTSPHANMLGLYYQPLVYVAYETGLGIEGANKGLQRAIEAGFCEYDTVTEVVWVFNMAMFQVGKALKPADKRCLGMQYEYDELPENPYLERFFDTYHVAFCLTKKRYLGKEIPPSLEAPTEPHLSQAKAQAQAQAQAQAKAKAHISVRNVQANGLPKSPRRKSKFIDAERLSALEKTWESYCQAYLERYGTEPVRNSTTDSQVQGLVKRLGADEAPQVAAWFLGHRDAWYVRQLHQFGCLLKDCEKLRTEWATNRQMTHTQARQADRQGNTLTLVNTIIANRERSAG